MKVHPSLAGTLAAFGAACAGSGKKEALRPVERVDLARYMGAWRILACMDNAAERNFVDAVETYHLREDGSIAVNFRWRHQQFIAPEKQRDFTGHVSDPISNACWKIRLFPFFNVSYVIIALHPEYRWAAVAHPSRKFGWVLARERSLPQGEYEEILRAFAEQGYDTSQFIKVPQVELA
jgi:apolipoprotein D and lipocalin family protein